MCILTEQTFVCSGPRPHGVPETKTARAAAGKAGTQTG